VKHRDIWDIAWLTQKKVRPALDLINQKLSDHHVAKLDFLSAFSERLRTLKNDPEMAIDFQKEMSRFLPNEIVKENINSALYWTYLCNLMGDFESHIA
jgi:hypothetical protein